MNDNDIQELLELAEDAMSYTPYHLRRKWDMDKRLADLRVRLTIAEADAPRASESGQKSPPIQ